MAETGEALKRANSIRKVFADRLQGLRNGFGLNQSQLAEKLGVSRGSISYYENQDRTPDIVFLDKVATYFDVSLDYLLGYSYDEMKKDKFLKTEFGFKLRNMINLLDELYEIRSKYAEQEDWEEFHLCCCRINEFVAGLKVFKLAIKQFYNIECNFIRTDEYYGICTADSSDWLFKIERKTYSCNQLG